METLTRISKTPWRAVASHGALDATVKDVDDNDLFTAEIAIASRVTVAVNAYTGLMGWNAHLIETLKALRVQLRALPTYSPGLNRAIDLVESTLRAESPDCRVEERTVE